MRSNLKNARNSASLIAVLFISVIWVQPAQAQSPDTRAQDIQQLKDKLQQLEQMMGEVKGKITVLEGQPGTPSSEASIGESKNGPNDTLVSAVTSFDAISDGAFFWSSGRCSSTWQAGGPEEAWVREHAGYLWVCHDGCGL